MFGSRVLAPSLTVLALAAAGTTFWLRAADRPPVPDGPQYSADGKMLRPSNYREWVFLSSGLGMTYGPLASGTPRFDNVFVSPSAYQGFLATGQWPDKTVMILEVRAADSKGSINVAGNYQTTVVGVEAHVKDVSLFPGGWAFFQFGKDKPSVESTPKTASCFTCHEGHGAVDTTFVQFYPTLIETAKKKGTYHGE